MQLAICDIFTSILKYRFAAVLRKIKQNGN